jgi:hypothetical protein
MQRANHERTVKCHTQRRHAAHTSCTLFSYSSSVNAVPVARAKAVLVEAAAAGGMLTTMSVEACIASR